LRWWSLFSFEDYFKKNAFFMLKPKVFCRGFLYKNPKVLCLLCEYQNPVNICLPGGVVEWGKSKLRTHPHGAKMISSEGKMSGNRKPEGMKNQA
jgi:hypothetical protein